ncbi:hypothetical protein POTOM_001667 [Populus tomentosa]|uniref:GOLD domain-containing protein n=1 Tax=Populus tomentosa TaxID=118781 RepID=A0A8X8DII3_POPTO|nr:hypothetical protein POTOM_001667 [Populus tomentosa]
MGVRGKLVLVCILGVLICSCNLFMVSEAVWLNLPASGTKCVSEEIHNNVVVLVDYVVVSDNHSHIPSISVKIYYMSSSGFYPSMAGSRFDAGDDLVLESLELHDSNSLEEFLVTSPYGNNLHLKENVTHGQFAFTTHEAGNYLACFWVDGHVQGSGDVSVNIDWKTGIAAKDWDSVARKEKIEGVELELRKLEGAVEAIHENLLYLKSREEELRSVSEVTNTRVALFSFMSLGVCIAVSALQVWHLKRYFQKKKLI